MRYSKSDVRRLQDQEIIYSVSQGKQISIPISELVFFYDISNGMSYDSMFRSESRITPLLPSILNIQEAQSAKNVNLKFSKKHVISSAMSNGDSMREGLSPEDKNEIERKTYQKDIIASESGLEIHSMANDFRKLMLDEGLAAEMMRVGGAYGIGRDLINWHFSGASTHENKDSAEVHFIQDVIGQESDDWGNTWTNQFGYREQGKLITIKHDHLPVMQVLKEKKIAVIERKISIAEGLVRLGKSSEDALAIVGLKDMQYEN